MRIGLIGFGTVGQGVYQLYQERREALEAFFGEAIHFAGIAVRNKKKKRMVPCPSGLFTEDSLALVQDPTIDCLVEVSSDGKRGFSYLKEALFLGKRVVTANKAALALDFPALEQAAEAGGGDLAFEAAVCGGLPLIRPLARQLVLNEVTSLRGIVNGSSNYILTALQEGASKEEVLAQARRMGILEEDSDADRKGWDARRKLTILANLVLAAPVLEKDLPCLGMEKIDEREIAYVKKSGRTIRLLASLSQGPEGALGSVAPWALLSKDPLARVRGVMNRLDLRASHLGAFAFYGPGAGQEATANAIWSDLVSRQAYGPFVKKASPKFLSQEAVYYIRQEDRVSFARLSPKEAEDLAKEAVLLRWVDA